jgi:hypothetical protein
MVHLFGREHDSLRPLGEAWPSQANAGFAASAARERWSSSVHVTVRPSIPVTL